MEIETERLRLRMIKKEDADDLHRIFNIPGFGRYFPEGFQPSRDSTLVTIGRFLEQWTLRRHGVWILEKKDESGKMFGYCGLRFLPDTQEVEILYGADKGYWGRGLVTEAARATLRFGFEHLKLDRIIAVTHTENIGSRRVMEKCDMKYEKDAVYFTILCACYAIYRNEYEPDGGYYLLKD